MGSLLWRLYARVYDGLLEVEAYRDLLGQVITAADCAGKSVLDVGCGTGNGIRAALNGGARHVLGVDIAKGMIDRAHAKLGEDVEAGRVELILGDAVKFLRSLPDQCVDRVMTVNSLYALDDRPAFFRECRRILASDGFIVAAHPVLHGSGPIVRDQLRRRGWRGVVRPRLLAIAAVDLGIDLLERRGRFDYTPVEDLAREAARAGLSRTTVLGRCYGGEHDGIDELVRFEGVTTVTIPRLTVELARE